MLFGGTFCISILACLYGAFQTGFPITSAMEPQSNPGQLESLDHRTVTWTLLVGGITFLVGLCMLLPAFFFGRRKIST
jgi:hypothetical protein